MHGPIQAKGAAGVQAEGADQIPQPEIDGQFRLTRTKMSIRMRAATALPFLHGTRATLRPPRR
jgi:hypothetical protein